MEQNTRNLNRIGWGILAFTLVNVLLPVLVALVYASKIPGDIYYPFWSVFFDNGWGFCSGLAVLLLANAFKQGYLLQQEKDLTI